MQKLYLMVSENIPELPQGAIEEGTLVIKRIRELSPPEGGGKSQSLKAFLLDTEFIKTHCKLLNEQSFPEGSILLWNLNGDNKLDQIQIPDSLIYAEITSFANPANFFRPLRNLYRNLYLERELEEKKEALKAKRKENKELLEVGIALSAERDNDKLLELILRMIREITAADAGSLYLLKTDEITGEKSLLFKIAQNDSNPTDFTEFSMPLDTKSIGGYVASTGEILNLKDVYKIPPDKEYAFNKSYDLKTGYRTKSMLTLPMIDHKDEILGAIQLINRKKDGNCRICTPEATRKYVIPFSKEHESLALSLGAQAAVSLENNMLYQEIEDLFEGLVKASVRAIESRDPTTSGHSNRVAFYTVLLARAVDRVKTGVYRNISFSREQIKEIRYASLLHDFGKVGVRENVLVKEKKLYPPQLELVKMRFAYIQKAMELSIMQQRFNILMSKGIGGYQAQCDKFDAKLKKKLYELEKHLRSIVTVNMPTVPGEESEKILDELARNIYLDIKGQEQPILTEDEYAKLNIQHGSLDKMERKEIESHVTHTYLFLKTIPWTKSMQKIPSIAYGHHEKLDGVGYPRGLISEEIPIQTRMMTISDIYDALTSMDRPYKKVVSPKKALEILENEVEGNHIDPELLRVFIEAEIYKETDSLLKNENRLP